MGLQGPLLPLCREKRRLLKRGGYEICSLLLPFSPCFSLHPSSPPQQPAPPQRLGRGRRAELWTEGAESPQCPVSEGSSGQGSYTGSCCPPVAAASRMMLGTPGLWALLPAAVQGKCLQGGAASFHSPIEGKRHLKQQSPLCLKNGEWGG